MREYEKQGISKLEYNYIHNWIRKNYGKANTCEFCNVAGQKRYHWALKKGETYSKNISSFIQLCVKCHSKYDFNPDPHIERSIKYQNNPPDPFAKRLEAFQGLKGHHHPSSKRIIQYSISGDLIREWLSIIEASEYIGVNSAAISNCLAGRTKNSGGFIWKFKNQKNEI